MDAINGHLTWSRTDFENAQDIRWHENLGGPGYSCHGVCIKHWKRWYNSQRMLEMMDMSDGSFVKIKESQITDIVWESK